MTIAPTLNRDEAAKKIWDVVIVGAGPAGSTAALLLARLGYAVLLVDKNQFPRWKVCGCCLTAQAQALLAQHIGDQMPNARPLHHLRWTDGQQQALLPLPGWSALSREALDAALVRAAIVAGAAFLPGTCAAPGPISQSARQIILHEKEQAFPVSAKLILAADGLGGRFLAGETNSPAQVEKNSRIGAGAVVPAAPNFYTAGTVYMACGAGGYMGLVRLEDGRLDVAAAFDPAFVRNCGLAGAAAFLLREMNWPPIPALAESRWRGTVPLTRRPAALGCERILALGDAAGYVEPFTGEGITWALTAAAAVVPLARSALHHWSPALVTEWAAVYRHVLGRRQFACRLLAQILRRPALVRPLLAVVRRAPAMGSSVIRYISAAR